MTLSCRALLLACLAGLATLARAQQAGAQQAGAWSPSLLASGGTLGFGPELDVRVPSSRFGVRTSTASASTSRT